MLMRVVVFTLLLLIFIQDIETIHVTHISSYNLYNATNAYSKPSNECYQSFSQLKSSPLLVDAEKLYNRSSITSCLAQKFILPSMNTTTNDLIHSITSYLRGLLALDHHEHGILNTSLPNPNHDSIRSFDSRTEHSLPFRTYSCLAPPLYETSCQKSNGTLCTINIYFKDRSVNASLNQCIPSLCQYLRNDISAVENEIETFITNICQDLDENCEYKISCQTSSFPKSVMIVGASIILVMIIAFFALGGIIYSRRNDPEITNILHSIHNATRRNRSRQNVTQVIFNPEINGEIHVNHQIQMNIDQVVIHDEQVDEISEDTSQQLNLPLLQHG